jgi:hypothetical protein
MRIIFKISHRLEDLEGAAFDQKQGFGGFKVV